MSVRTNLLKASLVQNELQNEILWLANLNPPGKLKVQIDALIKERQGIITRIDESVRTISIDIPKEAEKYLPKEEKVEGPVLEDPISPEEPIGKG
jgi:hypothetical protein